MNQKRKIEAARVKKLADMKAAADEEDNIRVAKLRAKKEKEAKD